MHLQYSASLSPPPLATSNFPLLCARPTGPLPAFGVGTGHSRHELDCPCPWRSAQNNLKCQLMLANASLPSGPVSGVWGLTIIDRPYNLIYPPVSLCTVVHSFTDSPCFLSNKVIVASFVSLDTVHSLNLLFSTHPLQNALLFHPCRHFGSHILCPRTNCWLRCHGFIALPGPDRRSRQCVDHKMGLQFCSV